MARTRVLTCGLIVLLVLAVVSPARAGEVIFSIRDGRVTLVAHNASLSDILAVWEREGRTKIVARERVQGMVVSLELTNEPESTALATILRSVTGYIAAKHAVPPRDASTYRCIIINPVPAPTVLAQSAPAAPAPPPRGGPVFTAPQRFSDPNMLPPAVSMPPADTDDDGGPVHLQMPVGGRMPGMATPANPARPQLDSPAAIDQATRPAQPSLTPGFPGAGAAAPGAVAPGQKPPGTPTTPIQKPPGTPIRQDER